MNPVLENRIILLVEDSDDDAFFFERAFAGAQVSSTLIRVANGAEAVEFLQRAADVSLDLSQSHCIFLDLKLPVLSGFEVLKWIKERGIHVEVIILSGSDIDSDIELARTLGASEYLTKPISVQEIRKRLACETVPD